MIDIVISIVRLYIYIITIINDDGDDNIASRSASNQGQAGSRLARRSLAAGRNNVYTYMYRSLSLSLSIHIYIYIHLSLSIYIYIHMYVLCVYIYTYMNTITCVQVIKYSHTYIHTYIHT